MCEIPSWLFFGLYYGMENRGKWNDEKEKVAKHILRTLSEHGKSQYWPPIVLDKVLYVNKNDDANPYGITPNSKKK